MVASARKKLVRDQAICLSRRDFSETSLVVVMLCRELGKVSLLAKGARRPRSPIAVDVLDTGQAGLIVNVEGLGLLCEFTCTSVMPQMRRDIQKWRVGQYLGELASLATKELAPAAELFDLLTDALSQTCRACTSDELAAILLRTAVGIVSWAGYHPQLECCVGCRRTMTPTDRLFFSASQGGLLCRDCEPTVVDKVRMEHRAWYCLQGKVADRVSSAKAFDVMSYVIREQFGKTPRMEKHCRAVFKENGR